MRTYKTYKSNPCCDCCQNKYGKRLWEEIEKSKN